MKSSLNAELSTTRFFVVDKDRTLGFTGEEGRVYATPSLICETEQICQDLIVEQADAGEESVGMDVAMRNTAPTLPGMRATARDDVEWIAEGNHTRFVFDTAKTLERLKAKAAKRSAAVG